MWGKHDWTQPRVEIFTNDMDNSFGKAKSLEDFCRKAQFINYEGPKAMMETWQSNRGGGVIVWMTHPSWPSFICQSYDYYFDQTAAYFAFKKGSEPVHVFWRADNDKVQLSNNTLINLTDLTVKVMLYDFVGKLIVDKSYPAKVLSNSVIDIATIEYPIAISDMHFIKLQLLDNKGNILSDNFYWRNKKYMDYKLLNDLPKVSLLASAQKKSDNQKTTLQLTLINQTILL